MDLPFIPLDGPPPQPIPGEGLSGWFLLASENLLDPNFLRTVVFMVQHDSRGALGLVINRPTTGRLGDLFPTLAGHFLAETQFSWGGPVEQNQLFILRREDPAVPESFPGLRPLAGIVFEPLTQIFFDYILGCSQSSCPDFRVFAGYSGWEGLQLEGEYSQDSWYLQEGDPDSVFESHPEDLYLGLMKKGGAAREIIARTGLKVWFN